MKSIEEISDIELEDRKRNPEWFVAPADILPGEQLPLVLDAIRRQAIEETIRRSEDIKKRDLAYLKAYLKVHLDNTATDKIINEVADDILAGVVTLEHAVASTNHFLHRDRREAIVKEIQVRIGRPLDPRSIMGAAAMVLDGTLDVEQATAYVRNWQATLNAPTRYVYDPGTGIRTVSAHDPTSASVSIYLKEPEAEQPILNLAGKRLIRLE